MHLRLVLLSWYATATTITALLPRFATVRVPSRAVAPQPQHRHQSVFARMERRQFTEGTRLRAGSVRGRRAPGYPVPAQEEGAAQAVAVTAP